ncbi:MAG: nitroreductase [Hyphomonadaceae bacterium]|nr:nitroreductase [Hyphomonadaceae bacterium]
MDVDTALKTRISTRVFRPDPLPENVVREILDVARWAPSGGNVQPWKVIAVSGAERQAVIDLAQTTLAANPRGEEGDRPIYPADLWEPHRSWRFKVGEDMYALLGIPREDKAARFGHLARNFRFFDAPVGLFFVIDRRMGHGQWAHLGMFMQSIALAAEARGVASCMQEAWGRVRETLAKHFALPETEMIYCGMALGYADTDAKVNSLRSDRASVDEFATFKGF